MPKIIKFNSTTREPKLTLWRDTDSDSVRYFGAFIKFPGCLKKNLLSELCSQLTADKPIRVHFAQSKRPGIGLYRSRRVSE